jgi:hypothetical protein
MDLMNSGIEYVVCKRQWLFLKTCLFIYSYVYTLFGSSLPPSLCLLPSSLPGRTCSEKAIAVVEDGTYV